MATRNTTVIGVFANRDNAQAALNELRQNGFRDDQIGLVSRVREDGTPTTGYTAQGEHVREKTGVGEATGSRWEIFLPPEQAYGNTPRSPIGPNQAVVFDVKVVEVK